MFSLGGKIADTFGCCESIPCKLQISTFILTLFVKFKTKHIGFYFTFSCIVKSIPCKLQISTFILTLFVKFKTKHIGFYFTFSCIILPGSHFYHGFLCKCDLFGFSLFIFDLL